MNAIVKFVFEEYGEWNLYTRTFDLKIKERPILTDIGRGKEGIVFNRDLHVREEDDNLINQQFN